MKYISEKAIDFGNVYKVYVLTFPDNRKYIGMTRQPIKRRWKANEYKSKAMKEAISTFGWDNVKKEIIAENLNLEQAGKLEVELIEKYKTLDRNYGFNTTRGGDTFNIHSEQFLNELHNRMIGNKYCVGRKISTQHIQALQDGRTEESYRKIAEKNRGRKHSESFKKALSIRAKERWKNQEYRNKYLLHRPDTNGEKNPMYGKHHSDTTKEILRKQKLGKKASPELRQKLSDASTNKKKVLQINALGEVVNSFNSIKEAALAVNAHGTNIVQCCKHEHKTIRGFYWRYAE